MITDKANSDAGVFTVHRIDDRIYYEIPPSLLDRVMPWSTEIAQLPANPSYGGQAAGHRVVRWTSPGNRVCLRLVDSSIRSEATGAIRTAIAKASLKPIIAAFDMVAEGKDKATVIEVTRLLNSDTTEFSVRPAAEDYIS